MLTKEEITELFEDLKSELTEEELIGLDNFIENYLLDNNSPKSFMYILNSLYQSGILKKAANLGQPIEILLEKIFSKIDPNYINIDNQGINECSKEITVKFDEYCEDNFKPIVDNLVNAVDQDYKSVMSDFYDDDLLPRVRRRDD